MTLNKKGHFNPLHLVTWLTKVKDLLSNVNLNICTQTEVLQRLPCWSQFECLPLSFQHWPLSEGPAEMHSLLDALQDGGEGGDGLLHQEDETDFCWAAELVCLFYVRTWPRLPSQTIKWKEGNLLWGCNQHMKIKGACAEIAQKVSVSTVTC